VRGIAAGLVLAALAGVVCGGGAAAARRGGGAPLGLVLPAADGGEIELAAYRGQVVVLHVFTTWSLAATADVPQIAEADAQAGVRAVGIALDPEGYAVVAPWRRALGVGYLVALADDELRAGRTALGRVAEVPVTIVLDRWGQLVRRIDRQLADGELAAVLAEAARDR
jgi:hypothetical protein